jgi:hypothetical protein
MIDAEDLVGRHVLKVTTSWHHYRETEPSLLHMWPSTSRTRSSWPTTSPRAPGPVEEHLHEATAPRSQGASRRVGAIEEPSEALIPARAG